MTRQPLKSSNLVSVGYDEESHLLEVEFKSRDVYQYSSVPPQVYAALLSAPSPGQYFHQWIRGQYATKRV